MKISIPQHIYSSHDVIPVKIGADVSICRTDIEYATCDLLRIMQNIDSSPMIRARSEKLIAGTNNQFELLWIVST